MEADELDAVNAKLADATAEEIVAWADGAFDALAMTSSFQTQSLPLLHIVSRVAPDVPILFLDTGYHFPETIAYRDRVAADLGLNLQVLHGDKSAEHAAQQGPDPLHVTDPDTCCFINKVEPLEAALDGFDGWISGIRRDQTSDRADAAIVEDTGDIVRVHPVLAWTADDVQAYLERHDLPRHPLSDRGYTSIGCQPCTRRPTGDDPRSGRWHDRDKVECGIHTTLRPNVRFETEEAAEAEAKAEAAEGADEETGAGTKKDVGEETEERP